jgi:hypothetical protein
LDGIFCVYVVVVAVSFAIAAPTATIDGDEENQVNNQQNISQHQDDAQRRLVGPKETQHQPTFSSSNADRCAVVIIPRRRNSGRRRARLRRHYTWFHYCPIPRSFLTMGIKKIHLLVKLFLLSTKTVKKIATMATNNRVDPPNENVPSIIIIGCVPRKIFSQISYFSR